MRAAGPLALVMGLALAASASGQARFAATPDKACTARTAKAADPGEVAADPAAFAGKCVRLDAWWRDIAVYPTRAEAAVVDALSLALLDDRRVGLYLAKPDLDAAPQAPKLATVIGTVGGACAAVPAEVRAADAGYCHYKGGAYLAVRSIALAK